MRSIIAAIAATTITVGCATPTSGPLVQDAGPEPTAAQAEELIAQSLRRSLKDPDSLKQYRLIDITRITWHRGLGVGGHERAWIACFEYNAKNSYGAYTGVKSDGLVMRVGEYGPYVIHHVNWALADARC